MSEEVTSPRMEETKARRFATTENKIYFLVKDGRSGTVHIGSRDSLSRRDSFEYCCGTYGPGGTEKVDPEDVLLFFEKMSENDLVAELMSQLRHSGKVCRNCTRNFFGKGLHGVSDAEEHVKKLVKKVRTAFPIEFSPNAVGVPKTQLVEKFVGESFENREDALCLHLQVTYTLRDMDLATIMESISELVEKAREYAEVTNARLTTNGPLDVPIDV